MTNEIRIGSHDEPVKQPLSGAKLRDDSGKLSGGSRMRYASLYMGAEWHQPTSRARLPRENHRTAIWEQGLAT